MAKSTSNGKRVNKAAAMRQTVSALGNDATAKDIQGHLKNEHGVEMSLDMIYTYKGNAIKQLGKRGVRGMKRGRKPGKVRAEKLVGAVSMADIEAVSEIVKKLGAEKVQKLAAVLG